MRFSKDGTLFKGLLQAGYPGHRNPAQSTLGRDISSLAGKRVKIFNIL